ncbi:hypothetical protein CEXT_390851 [Caerostris extrusa]|uniref:Uncharacterized protein n=1 Tax=Caerostris extrusa TaxID=172846 RepID=A0AAV4VYR1_CAEEX|nr:hypothetical protein CEXT_390851 [Caerostris extrusa]
MDGNFPKTSRIIIICYLFHQLHPLTRSCFLTDYMGDSFHCSVFLALGTPRNVCIVVNFTRPLSPVQMSHSSPPGMLARKRQFPRGFLAYGINDNKCINLNSKLD